MGSDHKKMASASTLFNAKQNFQIFPAKPALVAVKSIVNTLIAFVNIQEFFKERIVNLEYLQIRRVGVGDLNTAWNVIEAEVAQGGCGQERCSSQIGLDGIFNLLYGAIENVGMDLTPDIGVGPPANHVDGVPITILNYMPHLQTPPELCVPGSFSRTG